MRSVLVKPIDLAATSVAIYSFLFLLVGVAASNEQLIDNYNTDISKALLWGPYRPNAYMGIRPRLAHSLISGLFWFNADELEGINDIRHFCDQNQDFQGFGWEKYDARLGGRQVLKDNGLNIDITTDFVKREQGWGLKVKGVPRPGFEDITTSIVFYTGLEGEGALVSASGKPEDGFKRGENIKLVGHSIDFGGFEIDISDGPETNEHKLLQSKAIADPTMDPERTHYLSLKVPDEEMWKAKDIFAVLVRSSISNLIQANPQKSMPHPSSLLTLRNLNNFEGPLHFVQKTFTGSFEFDIVFNTDDNPHEISTENLDSLINSTLNTFDKRFEKSYDLKEPFTNEKYAKFGKEFLSNLMGGIGYFYGDHLVDRKTKLNEDTYEELKLNGVSEGNFELFTAIPSRTFFPRGFYWDEGFHLIPILQYDLDLSLEILKSWFNLIDEDGWIAREQILGPEARSKVPEEFQVQSPEIANPPTMMLVFTELLNKAKQALSQSDFNEYGDIDEPSVVDSYGNIPFGEVLDSHLRYPELLIDYAEQIYPKLKLHYEWFRKTQKGELEEFERAPYSPVEAYRWRGRTFTHCLPSGLDDYPRAEVPDIAELNVDLISWIGAMTRAMKEISELLGKTEDSAKYSKIEIAIQKNIDDLHWSEKDKAYCDVSVDKSDEDVFVCHKGYVSLFPFLLKLISPSSDHLYDVIKLISDPDELFSDYGIRSLSKKDKYYRTGENYWKSPIWVNMNYLVLDALQYYASGDNASKLDQKTLRLANDTYKQLRVNLVENVFNGWEKTGFAFEQYDDVTGKPQKNKHFYGWTSLVAVIMTMPESLI